MSSSLLRRFVSTFRLEVHVRLKKDSHHLQDAAHDMRRYDDSCFCVDGGETVEEDVGAVDFVRQRVRSVSGRSSRSDRRSYRHDVAPVGVREPARCFASTEDVFCHQELPTVTLRERDEICLRAASSISFPIARRRRTLPREQEPPSGHVNAPEPSSATSEMERMERTRPLRAAMEDRREDCTNEIWDDRLDAIKGETASMKETDGEVASEPIESLRLIATAAAAMSIETPTKLGVAARETGSDKGWSKRTSYVADSFRPGREPGGGKGQDFGKGESRSKCESEAARPGRNPVRNSAIYKALA